MPANPPAPRPVVSGTMSVGHVSDVSTSIELGIEQARRNEGDFLEDAPRPVSELSRNEFDEVVQRLVDGAALSVPLGERMLATYAALSRPQGRGDAALKAVLGLHGIVGDGVRAKCEGCGEPYPCQTRRAIDQLYDASLPSGRGDVSAETLAFGCGHDHGMRERADELAANQRLLDAAYQRIAELQEDVERQSQGRLVTSDALRAAEDECFAISAAHDRLMVRERETREALKRLHSAVDTNLMGDSDLPDDDSPLMLAMQEAASLCFLSALDGQRREGKRREGKPRPAGYELAGMPVYLDASLPEHTIRIVASDGKVLAEQSFAPEPPLLPTRTEVEQAVDAFAEAYVEVVADVFCDDARFKVLDEKRDAARSALLALIPTQTEERNDG